MDSDSSERKSEEIVFSRDGTEFRKEEIYEVARAFSLKKIIDEPKCETFGNSNYIFKIATEDGNFMIRTNAKENSPDKSRRLTFEHDITKHLRKNGFPFQVPEFLKSKEGNETLKRNGKLYDLYKRVEGEPKFGGMSDEVIKAVAIMHKTLERFPNHTRPSSFPKIYDEEGWTFRKLQTLQELLNYPRSEAEEQLAEKMPIVFDAYKELISYARPIEQTTIAHRDVHPGNLIYSDGKLKGVIDFGSSGWGTKGEDLGRFVYGNEERFLEAVEKYREINYLSKNEANNIIPEKINQLLNSLWWVHSVMTKNIRKRDKMLSEKLNQLEDSFVNWQNIRRKLDC